MAILIVGAGQQYTTISSALSAASAGDTIRITAGTYTENITILRNDITLEGAKVGEAGDDVGRGMNETVIRGSVTVRGTGATLDGLTVATPPNAQGNQDRLIDARGSGNTVPDNLTLRGTILNVGKNINGELQFGIEARGSLTVEDSVIARNLTGAAAGTLGRAAIRTTLTDNVTVTGTTIENGNISVQTGTGTSAAPNIQITGNAVTPIAGGTSIIVTGPAGGSLPSGFQPVGDRVQIADNVITSGRGSFVVGSDGDDDLSDVATDSADQIDGRGGNDTLSGGRGDDTLTGGAGNDTFVLTDGGGSDLITDFDLSDPDGDGRTADRLDVSRLRDASGGPTDIRDIVVTQDAAGNAVLTFGNGERVTLRGVRPDQIDEGSEQVAAGIPCYTPGTLIATRDGLKPVEALRPGDALITVDTGYVPLRWTATSHLDESALDLMPNRRPILIPEGAIGNDRTMLVSPQHGFLVTAAMPQIPAEFQGRVFLRALHMVGLIPGVRVARGRRQVSYVHLLCEGHRIVLADGVWSETFHPGKQAFAYLSRIERLRLIAACPRYAEGPALPEETARPYLTRAALRQWSPASSAIPVGPSQRPRSPGQSAGRSMPTPWEKDG